MKERTAECIRSDPFYPNGRLFFSYLFYQLRVFNFDIGGDVRLVSRQAVLTVAVAILFAAVSNQEKLVTPRLATLDTKST